MGFLWEGSTGARAVKFLREQGQGTELETSDLAAALDVKAGALYQLLANAVKLRFIRKVPGPGQSIRWKLGAAGDSVTIERRRPTGSLSSAEMAWRRATNERRRQHAASVRDARSEVRPQLDAAGAEPAWPAHLPDWLIGGHASSSIERPPRDGGKARPASYLARWHVLYRDARGQLHSDLQVQAVHAELGFIDAWCEARRGVDRFALSGFARVADAESGERVDLQTWLTRAVRTSVAVPATLTDGAGACPRGRSRRQEVCRAAVA